MSETVTHATVGRRKKAVARARLQQGKGKFSVNGIPFTEYFRHPQLRQIVLRGLQITEREKSFDIRIRVAGGGLAGQAQASSHSLARALQKFEPELRIALKKEGLLTRDPRSRERKKPGRPGARKRFQFSKR